VHRLPRPVLVFVHSPRVFIGELVLKRHGEESSHLLPGRDCGIFTALSALITPQHSSISHGTNDETHFNTYRQTTRDRTIPPPLPASTYLAVRGDADEEEEEEDADEDDDAMTR